MYSRISSAKDGYGSIRYAEGSAHNGNKERNLLIDPINLIPDNNYARQMAVLWKKARKNHKVQTRRIVISFSKKELDPTSFDDLDTARSIIREFVESYYPDRQAVCYYQRDGKGGCLHCHIIINDVSMTDYKGCTREQSHYKYVRKGIDKTAGKYITLYSGKAATSKLTLTERVKADKAKIIIEQNPELSGIALREKLLSEKAYSYKADMKERIHDAMTSSTNESAFKSILKKSGISLKKKISKKYGTYYVYDFTGCPVSVRNKKARSYKLGFSYSPEAAELIWNEHKAKEKAKADDFNAWLKKCDKRCFEFDSNGKLISSDFKLLEELREEFEKEKEQKDVIDEKLENKNFSDTGSLPKAVNSTNLQNAINIKAAYATIQRDLISLGNSKNIINSLLDRIAVEQAKAEKSGKRYKEAIAMLNLNSKGGKGYDKLL